MAYDRTGNSAPAGDPGGNAGGPAPGHPQLPVPAGGAAAIPAFHGAGGPDPGPGGMLPGGIPGDSAENTGFPPDCPADDGLCGKAAWSELRKLRGAGGVSFPETDNLAGCPLPAGPAGGRNRNGGPSPGEAVSGALPGAVPSGGADGNISALPPGGRAPCPDI